MSFQGVDLLFLCQAMNYLGLDWTGSVDLTNDLEEFKAINMEADCNIDSQNKQLSLSIHVNQRLSMDLFIYSPYWIINKTGLPVQIRVSNLSKFWLFKDSKDNKIEITYGTRFVPFNYMDWNVLSRYMRWNELIWCRVLDRKLFMKTTNLTQFYSDSRSIAEKR